MGATEAELRLELTIPVRIVEMPGLCKVDSSWLPGYVQMSSSKEVALNGFTLGVGQWLLTCAKRVGEQVTGESAPTVDLRALSPEQDAHGARLYDIAEDAAAAGMTLDQAVQIVRDGFSSVEADRVIRDELRGG